MANLKEIRNRIASTSSTKQITSAMKMVSAAKLKRAQDAITQMRPYAEKLQSILSNLSASLDLSENPYSEVRDENKTLIVAISSNRGLCGGFNNNIIKEVNQLIGKHKEGEVSVLPIGKKVRDAFKKGNFFNTDAALGNFDEVYGNLNFDNVAAIAEKLMEAFAEGNYNRMVLVYNQFVNAASQAVRTEQYLPIPKSEEQGTTSLDYIFQPTKAEIVADLIPKSLKIQLYKALLDSNASEHGARMTAMHKATDNASEMVRALKLDYNKARQAAITNEILEIVGGAEALNN